MTILFRLLLFLQILLIPLPAQILNPELEPKQDRKMPDGRSQTMMILKKEAEKSAEDMAEVLELAKALQLEIEENKFHVVDLGSVRKAEQIIKLVKRVKSRLNRGN